MEDKEKLIETILDRINFGHYYYDCLGDSEERIKEVITEVLQKYDVKSK